MIEEDDLFKDPDWADWDMFVTGYPRLGIMFKKPISVAPHLFTDSSITWAKVFDQLALPTRLGNFDIAGGDPKLVRCTVQMKKAWESLREPFRANSLPVPQPCAYPRCFQPFTHEKTLGVRYMCGRCGKAAYCNLNCQRAHWQLDTADSYRLECIPSETGGRPVIKHLEHPYVNEWNRSKGIHAYARSSH